MREAQDSGEKLTHNALQRSAEIEKAIQELKVQRANFRLQLQKMIELFQQVLEFDRDEDEKDRGRCPTLTRKANKEETARRALEGSVFGFRARARRDRGAPTLTEWRRRVI